MVAMNKLWAALLLLGSMCCNALGQHATNHSTPHHTPNHTPQSSSTPAPATQCKEPSLQCAKAATPYFAPDGALWVTWAGNGVIGVARSSDMGKSFEPGIEIARHGALLDTGPDARPQLVVNTKGDMVIAYAFFKDKQWNAQINISNSANQGKSFSTPRSLSSDTTSQRFPALSVNPEGKIFVAWIDKRLVAKAKKNGDQGLGGSIAYAWSNDMGQSFSPETIAEPNSCECCRIGLSTNPQGLPVMIYRAIFNGNVRDHATQLVLGENQTAPAQRVAVDNWKTDSCPHHGPTVTISSEGTYHAAWFTEGAARTGIFYARSADAGKSYSAPRAIGQPEARPGRAYLLAQNKTIWLAWKEFDGKRAAVFMQYSQDDGINWSTPKLVAETAGYSDHPILITKQNLTYLSWLTAAQGYRLISLDTKP